MTWRTRIIMMCIPLGGCATTQYVPCPTLVTYSSQDEAALSAEIRASPKPQTIRWIGDYIGLRDQVRACSGK